MARRARRDRVVASAATGGSWLYDPNPRLPRSTYRDVEALSGTLRRMESDRFTPFGRAPLAYKPRYVLTPVDRRLAPAGRMRARSPLPSASLSWRVNLNRIPSRVKFCVQRKRRREVLFAFGRAGFRGSAPKRSYRRTVNSNYGC